MSECLRRGVEPSVVCIIAPYPRCKVAGVLMRVRMWGEDRKRLFAWMGAVQE